MSTLLSAKSQGRFLPFCRKNPSKSTIFSRKPFQISPARDLTGGRRDYSRLSSCLPLTREVANPEGLTEGEIRRAYAKRDTQSGRVANSLPQSPAATAPSSEGAKGLGCSLRDSLLRESQGAGERPPVPSSFAYRLKNAFLPKYCATSPSSVSPQRLRCGGPVSFDRLGRRKNRLPAAGRRHSPAGEAELAMRAVLSLLTG